MTRAYAAGRLENLRRDQADLGVDDVMGARKARAEQSGDGYLLGVEDAREARGSEARRSEALCLEGGNDREGGNREGGNREGGGAAGRGA